MIEFAALKSVVDLFKQLINISDGRAKVKRDSFERTFKPLYERIEIVAKEYYGAVSKTASQLNKPSPDYTVILQEAKLEDDHPDAGSSFFEEHLPATPEDARRDAQYAVKTLEDGWKGVSKAYTELKLFCGA